MQKTKLTIFLTVLSIALFGMAGVASAAAEVLDNSIDEDGNGWLGTSLGHQIHASHPRVLLTAEHLQTVIGRMYGAAASDPYKSWFNLIKTSADGGGSVGFVNLALLYKATGDVAYKNKFISAIPATGTPTLYELYGVDIMFNDLDDAKKLSIMQRVSANPDSFYWNSLSQSKTASASWGYHSAHGVASALAYAGIFAYTNIIASPTVTSNPTLYLGLDIHNYITLVSQELSSSGNFYKIENRIAGDTTYNNALPGSFGGMYDNFGYDGSEESFSAPLLAEFYTLTGENRFVNFLHDKYRATFYQNMQYPYLFTKYSTDQWCRKANTESHTEARVWYAQVDRDEPAPFFRALTAFLYNDPKMQSYVVNGSQASLCGAPYSELFWDLVYYDGTIPVSPPSDNPLASYFSGPGLVSTRSDWANDAVFGVFIAGEGISRRYEDANSFLLGRKTDVAVHGGARIRYNNDNEKTHWYHVRSISKNTLKIFDPLESFDINADGTTGSLHSGTPLVLSDNMGGQIFETDPSISDKCYYAPDGNTASCRSLLFRKYTAFPLGVYETANITKYEHNPAGGYTYTVGDGTAAYTKKIEFFEREFVHIRPDTFVIFDRVKSVNPSYKKVWTMHTVDEPVFDGASGTASYGKKSYTDASSFTVTNPLNTTYFTTLIPSANAITIRGGDTVLVNAPLSAGQNIPGSAILPSDIFRWLELFAVGSDTLGSVTLSGNAEEGNGVSETIVFDGRTQNYVTSKPTSLTATQLQDTTQQWKTDQWKGYMVTVKTGSSASFIITGNNSNTLFGSFQAVSAWQYIINRPFANSYLHWKTITGVTTADMNVNNFIISVPHYFDAEDVSGRLHSFAPHTDAKNDGYTKRLDLGQWTFEVAPSSGQLLDNFLHVISLKDPSSPRPTVVRIGDANTSGALVDSTFVLFANNKTTITSAQAMIPRGGSTKGLIMDLIPQASYYYKATGNIFEISSTNNGGNQAQASSMGTLAITVVLSADTTAPSAPTGLAVN